MVSRLPRIARLTAPEVSPSAYRRVTAVTLAALVMIMVTGAAVRLTGSGLGCSTWPSCEPDSFTPRSASDSAGMVEFGNRMVTGAVGLVTVAAVLGARWRRPRRDDLYRWSLGLPAWVFANALVGAVVVWMHLAPVSVIAHFLLSLGAVWNAVVLHHKAGEAAGEELASPAEPDAAGALAPGPAAGLPAGPAAEAAAGALTRAAEPEALEPHVAPTPPARREQAVPAMRRACNHVVGAAALSLVSGTLVTGSGPHAGDEEADRLSLELGDIIRLHGASVILFLLLTLSALWMARRGDASPSVERRLRQLLVVLVAQGAVGYTQYFTGVPAALVAVHVLGAACVWIAVLRVRLSLTVAGTPEAASPRTPGDRRVLPPAAEALPPPALRSGSRPCSSAPPTGRLPGFRWLRPRSADTSASGRPSSFGPERVRRRQPSG